MAAEKHFLVWRDKDGLRKIQVFKDQRIAVSMYDKAENDLLLAGRANGMEVCLFSSDSLATLVRTHASWFAPETLDTQALLADIAREASGSPEGGEGMKGANSSEGGGEG